MLNFLHRRFVYDRRVDVLSRHLANLLPPDAKVLDVGTGDGLLARRVQGLRSDLRISGVDVLLRPERHIPVREFNGKHLPYEDASFDVVMFVDVLHHAENADDLLREAIRVARKAIVIKDHLADGFLARPTLRFMDRVGNVRHGVATPYLYRTTAEWERAFQELGLKVAVWRDKLGLYPAPMSFVFERRMHFIALLHVMLRAATAAA